MFLDNIISFLVRYYIKPAQAVALFYADNSRLILDYIHAFFKTSFDILLVITIIVSILYMGIMLYSFFTKRNPHQKGVGNRKLPFVTVQIPTYNELAAINCAKRCLDFDYPKDRYEIIIGDDSNNKEVTRQIGDFAAMHKSIIKVTRRGTNAGWKPGNLNHMLKFTKGEFIVIFDSDFLPERHFLTSIITPFMHDPKLAVVQTRWRISNFKQNLTTLLGGSTSLVMHHFAMPVMERRLHTSFLCGSAEAVRKQALVDVGGWQEGTLTEDIECSLRLIKKGYNLTYLEELECDCETPFTVKDFCKQQMRWAYGVISAFKEHFGSFFFNSKVSSRNKVAGAIMLSGYTFSFLLMCLFVVGMLSFFTDRPAPINWSLFLSETGRNIIITCGVMVVTLIALLKKSYVKHAAHLIVATFSVGLVVTAYVNMGILKAIFGRPMKWFMLSKLGNRQVAEK